MNNIMQKVKELHPNCQDPIFIRTAHNSVAVFGHEHVSKKELIILAHCLNIVDFDAYNPHGVKSVVFRVDNRPKDRFAECEPNSGSITVNLMKTFSSAMETAFDREEGVSVQAIYHRNMIMNFLHEIHHINFMRLECELNTAQTQEAEELAADWSIEKLMYLNDRVNLEPGPYTENPFLSRQIDEMLRANNDEFGAKQRCLLANETMVEFEETETTRATTFNFREYVYVLYTETDFEHKAAINGDDPILANILTINNNTTALISSPTEAVKEAKRALTKEEVGMAYGFIPAMHGFPAEAPAVGGLHKEVFDPADYDLDMSDVVDDLDGIEPPDNYEEINPGYDDETPEMSRPMPPPTPQPAVQQVVKQVPHNNHTMKTAGPIIQGVYRKIFTHVFMACRPLLNSDLGFEYPEGVTIPIMLTQPELDVVVGCDGIDEQGRWHSNMSTLNGLRGNITKNQKLPQYTLYINVGGELMKRVLIPQNVNSRYPNGQFKPVALAARGGDRIMWIMEGDDSKVKVGAPKYLLKIQNSVISKC